MARKTGSHAQITGPRVRAAAQMLFARHGYAAVSMRRIAAEVGVQAGALYLYTPDKQALLFELLQSHMQAVLAAWAAEPRGRGPVERLEAFVRFHIRFSLDHPEAVFLATMELRSLEPGPFAAISGLRRAYEDELAAILAEGAALGAFRLSEPRITAMAIIGLMTGVNSWFREAGRLDRAAVTARYLEMVRGALGAC